jgi:hypothetical protein
MVAWQKHIFCYATNKIVILLLTYPFVTGRTLPCFEKNRNSIVQVYRVFDLFIRPESIELDLLLSCLFILSPVHDKHSCGEKRSQSCT